MRVKYRRNQEPQNIFKFEATKRCQIAKNLGLLTIQKKLKSFCKLCVFFLVENRTYTQSYSSSFNLSAQGVLPYATTNSLCWLAFGEVIAKKEGRQHGKTICILNVFTDNFESQQFLNQQMQSFANCLGGFIHINSQQYFFLVPNCLTNGFEYYPFAAPFQIESPKQALVSPTLDVPFQTNLMPTEPKNVRQDLEKTKRSERQTKGRKSLSQKEHQQQSFNIKINKNEPCVTYKKKNTESNIVNQTFSYLNSDRSKKLISIILKNSQKVEEYYKIMTKIKQLNKKYINRNYLKRLLAFESSSQFQKAFLKAKATTLKIEEVKVILRSLIFNFLREQVNMTLMTSGKIYKETLPEHFWRKREIMTFLFGETKL